MLTLQIVFVKGLLLKTFPQNFILSILTTETSKTPLIRRGFLIFKTCDGSANCHLLCLPYPSVCLVGPVFGVLGLVFVVVFVFWYISRFSTCL